MAQSLLNDPGTAHLRSTASARWAAIEWVDRQLAKLLAGLLVELSTRCDQVDEMLERPWWRRFFG